MIPGKHYCLCQPGFESCLKEQRDLLLEGDERLERPEILLKENPLKIFASAENIYMPIL
jgi:hypothetical protein